MKTEDEYTRIAYATGLSRAEVKAFYNSYAYEREMKNLQTAQPTHCPLCGSYNGHLISCVIITRDFIEGELSK